MANSLGEISVKFHAATGDFLNKLKDVNKGVQATRRQFIALNKVLAQTASYNITPLARATRDIVKGTKGASGVFNRQSDALRGTVMNTHEAAYSAKTLASENKHLIKSGLMMSRSYKKVGEGAWRMSESMTAANKQTLLSMLSLRNMVGKITHYITFSIGVQMVMAIRQGFSDAIDSFKSFERAATNAATVAGYVGGAFEDVRDHIMDVSKELGRTTVFSAVDVANAFYQLASAGNDVADMTKNDLRPILDYAAATQAELEEATTSVQTAMKAFGLTIEETERIVDTFTGTITNSFMTFEKMSNAMKYVAPIAGTLGISIEETSAALATLVDTGLTGAQAGQRLNMIFTKLLKPTEEAKEMLEGMGLSVQDINPEVHSLIEILYLLKAAGFDASNAAEMFRARTAAAAAVLVDSADDIAFFNNMLHGTAGLTQSVADKQIKTLWGELTLLGDALQEAGIGFGESLMPAIKTIAEFIKGPFLNALGSIGSFLSKHGDTLVTLVKIFISYKVALFGVTSALSILANVMGMIVGTTSIQEIMMGKLTARLGEATMAQYGHNLALMQEKKVQDSLIATIATNNILQNKQAKITQDLTVLMAAKRAGELTDVDLLQTKLALEGKELGIRTANRELAVANIRDIKARIAARSLGNKQDVKNLQTASADLVVKRAQLVTNKQLSSSEIVQTVTKRSLIKAMWNEFLARMALNKGKEREAYLNTKLAFTQGLLKKGYFTAAAAGNSFVGVLKGIGTAIWSALGPIGLLLAALTAIGVGIYFLLQPTKNFTLQLSKMEDISLAYLAEDFTAVELALWEAERSSKNFLNAFEAITKNDITGLDKDMQHYVSTLAYAGENTRKWAEEGKDIFGVKRGFLTNLIGPIGTAFETFIPQIGDAIDDAIDEPIRNWGQDVFGEGKRMEQIAADASEATNKAIAKALGIDLDKLLNAIDFKNIVNLLATETVAYNNALKEAVDAQTEYSIAMEEVNKMHEEGVYSIKELADAQQRLADSEERLEEANIALTSSIKSLLQEMRTYSTITDEAIGYIEDFYNSQIKLESKYRELDKSSLRVSDNVERYADAIANSGYSSKEATEEFINLNDSLKDEADIKQEITDLIMEASRAEKNWTDLVSEEGKVTKMTYNQLLKTGRTYDEIADMMGKTEEQMEKVLKNKDKEYDVTIKATKAEKMLVETAGDLVDVTTERNQALLDYNRLSAIELAYSRSRDNATKYASEALRKYLEAQEKVYDIEVKLYKLRKDEASQLDDLFGKLAEEGLVSPEVIEGFKELKLAEAGVLKLNNKFAKSLDGLTGPQREQVEEFMNTERGTEAYSRELADLQEMYSAGIISKDQLDTFIAMNDAQDHLTDTVMKYKDQLGPLINDMIDMGLVSSDVAEAWADLQDNAVETAIANIDLVAANRELSESMRGVVSNIVTLSKALMDENVAIDSTGQSVDDLLDKERDLFDIYKEGEHSGKTVAEVLLQSKGMWDDVGSSMEGLVSQLEAFYGMDMASIMEEYGQGGIVAAIAMWEMADATGQWDKTLGYLDLAEQLGITDLNAFQSAAFNSWNEMDNMAGVLRDLADAFADWMSAADQMIILLEKISALSGNDNMMEISFRYDANELLDLYDDALSFFTSVAQEGIDLNVSDMFTETDEGWKSVWDSADWEAWAEMMSGDVGDIFKDNLSKIEGIDNPDGLSFGSTWDGETWKKFFKNNIDNMDKIDDVFSSAELMAQIQVLWDGYDFSQYDQLFGNNIDTIRNYLIGAGLDIPIDTVWEDGGDISSYLSNLSSGDLATLSNYLANSELTDIPMGLRSLTQSAVDVAIGNEIRTYLGENEFEVLLKLETNFYALLNRQIEHALETNPISLSDMLEAGIPPQVAAIAKNIGLDGPIPEAIANQFTEWINGLDVEEKEIVLDALFSKSANYDEIVQGFRDLFEVQSGVIPSSVTKEVSIYTNSEAATEEIALLKAAILNIPRVVMTDHYINTNFNPGSIDGGYTHSILAAYPTGRLVNRGGVAVPEMRYLSSSGEYKDMVAGTFNVGDIVSWATGGIANALKLVPGFAKGIAVTSGPTMAMIGENGPEAVVPLVNNRDNGMEILKTIIPRYFPELYRDLNWGPQMLAGGSVPGHAGGTTIKEEYIFYGDFNITGIQNADQLIDEFYDKIKEGRRMM